MKEISTIEYKTLLIIQNIKKNSTDQTGPMSSEPNHHKHQWQAKNVCNYKHCPKIYKNKITVKAKMVFVYNRGPIFLSIKNPFHKNYCLN